MNGEELLLDFGRKETANGIETATMKSNVSSGAQSLENDRCTML